MDTTIIKDFLKELTKNNNREWFHANKHKYEKAKQEFELFVNELIPLIQKFDNTIPLMKASDCMYRIYKDIRFSNNKDPYKLNFGAVITRGGRKSPYAGYYFHFELGGSFLAGGMWHPEPDILKRVRNDIYNNIDEFKEIINNKTFKKYFGNFDDDEKLKRSPKEYSAEWPDIELLKFKNFVAYHPLSDEDFKKKDLLKYSIDVFKAMQPFDRFLNESLSVD